MNIIIRNTARREIRDQNSNMLAMPFRVGPASPEPKSLPSMQVIRMGSEKKEMTLDDLVGEHELDAVDFSSESIKDSWGDGFEDCQSMRFRLDGVVYAVTEDPSDGYRSCMQDIVVVPDAEMTNAFTPIRVLARMQRAVLELIDIANGETVLEAGTDNADDYYPCFVASFTPEKMSVNASQEGEAD